MKLFRNIQFYSWILLSKTRFSSFHGVEELFFVWMLISYLKPFKFMAGSCSPTSLVTAQLISRRWKIISFWCYADCQQRSNDGWSCFPKHDPAHFTVSNNFLVWMVGNFSKTFDFMAGPCSPKHGPALFTMLKNLFVWMLCIRLKPFKFMAGPRSSTSPVTAQLISRRWRIFL